MFFATTDAVYSVYVIQKYVSVCLLSGILGHVIVLDISRDVAIQNFGKILDLRT